MYRENKPPWSRCPRPYGPVVETHSPHGDEAMERQGREAVGACCKVALALTSLTQAPLSEAI